MAVSQRSLSAPAEGLPLYAMIKLNAVAKKDRIQKGFYSIFASFFFDVDQNEWRRLRSKELIDHRSHHFY